MQSPRYVLSLDIGSATGWALLKDSTIVNSGTLDMKMQPGCDWPGHRLVKFRRFLEEIAIAVHEIVYEQVQMGFHKSMKSNKLYFNLQGILEEFCAVHRIPLCSFHPTTIKSAFAGNGRASKEDVARKAIEIGWTGAEWKGDEIVNHDESDAIALLAVYASREGIIARFESSRHHTHTHAADEAY